MGFALKLLENKSSPPKMFRKRHCNVFINVWKKKRARKGERGKGNEPSRGGTKKQVGGVRQANLREHVKRGTEKKKKRLKARSPTYLSF